MATPPELSAADELAALLSRPEPAPDPAPRPPSLGAPPTSRTRLVAAGLAAALLVAVVAVAVGSGSDGTLESSRAEEDRLEAEASALEAEPDSRASLAQASLPDVDPVRAAYPDVAVANSPNDGFVALRDSPSARSGSRLLRIPHGAEVRLGACVRPDVADGRAGSWCEASYDGVRGYAFDAFLDRY